MTETIEAVKANPLKTTLVALGVLAAVGITYGLYQTASASNFKEWPDDRTVPICQSDDGLFCCKVLWKELQKVMIDERVYSLPKSCLSCVPGTEFWGGPWSEGLNGNGQCFLPYGHKGFGVPPQKVEFEY